MTYDVFGGTLNLALSIYLQDCIALYVACVSVWHAVEWAQHSWFTGQHTS